MLENTAIVIPARMESRRLPGKPLLKMADGRTVLEATWAAARQVSRYVHVASPDPEIRDECARIRASFLGSLNFPTGTHRCADAIRGWDWSGVVVNWQVDEPRVPPAWVEMLVRELLGSDFRIATLIAAPTGLKEFLEDENRVKVWQGGDPELCAGFSRRDDSASFEHVGIYAFRPDALRELGRLPPSERSAAESLEQIAWLEAGYRILAVECPGPAPRAVNVEEDLR